MQDTLYIVFLIAISVLASQGINLAYKFGSTRTSDPVSSPPLLCTFCSFFIACIYIIMAFVFDGGISFPDRMSILYAMMLAISYSVAAIFYLLALSCGPYTISAILLNMSSFLPILYSRLFLGETISFFQLCALVIMMFSCVTLTLSRNQGVKSSKANTRWVIYIILMFFANSLISFSLRVNTRLAPETSLNSFLALAYTVAAIICFVFFLCSGGVKKKIQPKPLILPGLCVAASLGMQLTPTALLPKYLSSALQYPIEKGSAILFGVVVGMVFFKERINHRGWMSIAAIIAALCLIGIK
ncbi:MAG: DMT family transporter [Oscillospiraceae bacterium]|nr:DMT family transporter [Oscillospiraceae bacterium]